MGKIDQPPVIILARPQLGENIGAAARAMKNCGLTDLRLVAPRDGWPNPAAEPMAAVGRDVLDNASVFETLGAACHDINLLLATSARPRDLAKPVMGPRDGVHCILKHHDSADAGKAALLFGAERTGLDNDELAIADALIQADLNPEGSSLNLAQAVMVLAWEWRAAMLEAVPQSQTVQMGLDLELAPISDRDYFFTRLEALLDEKRFFNSPEMAPVVKRNLRTFFTRGQPSAQELRTLQGVLTVLTREPRD